MNEKTQRMSDAHYLRNIAWAIANNLTTFESWDISELMAIADRLAGQPEEDGTGKVYWYACVGWLDDEETELRSYIVSFGHIATLNDDGSPTISDTWRGSGPFLTSEGAWKEAERYLASPEFEAQYKDLLNG